jgi:tetratricopeptide (TPR) repeat protein
MSNAAEANAEEADKCCANCGIAPVDDIQLKECNGGCDLVKYCSIECQEHHSDLHEEECKQRKAEIRDKELFEQPDESHLGECPICFLPLPIDPGKSSFYTCCCKIVCNGCSYADYINSGKNNCPFCREPTVDTQEEHHKEHIKRVMERVKVNDTNALRRMGRIHFDEGDYHRAIEYSTKAAESGDARAHYLLGYMYYYGEGVEKDEEKVIHHWEKAAIGGSPEARQMLACYEGKNGNIERAVKHFIIAAKLGYEESMKSLWVEFKDGNITKDDLEDTLRSHKAAIDATKSEQRDLAEEFHQLLAASR